MIRILVGVIAVYVLFCWLDGREECRQQRRVEQEDRERGEPWL